MHGANVRASLLIVDDEEPIRTWAKNFLVRTFADVDVLTAPAAPEALAILAARPVDVIITDYKMPGPNGLDLLASARKMGSRAPGVLMTAYGEETLAISAVNKAHIAGFVSKPWDSKVFADIIAKLLKESRDRSQRESAFARAKALAERAVE